MKNILLDKTQELLEGLEARWAFCGGYALDIFLGKQTREHGDIDVCVFETDRETIKKHMLERGWDVYEFRGMGRVRKLHANSESERGRNLMCLKSGCELVDFYPCEEPGMMYYQFHHTGMKELDYIEFLFNSEEDDMFVFSKENGIFREVEKAIIKNGGYPYLAPEIALLYKASNADDENYRHDFEMTIHELDEEACEWFYDGLNKCYPQGHPWKRND